MNPQEEMLFMLRQILVALSFDMQERANESCGCGKDGRWGHTLHSEHYASCRVGPAQEWMKRVGAYFGWSEEGADDDGESCP